MREAVIVSAVRTAVGRAPWGSLRNTRPDDLASMCIGFGMGAAAVFEREPGY